MSQLPQIDLVSQLQSLPVHRDREHWEVGLIEVIPPGGAKPRTGTTQPGGLNVAMCVSSKDAAGMVPPLQGAHPEDSHALRAVAACALDSQAPGVAPIGYLPARVHVHALPPQMLETLRGTLAPLGIIVEVKSTLPRVEALAEMIEGMREATEQGDLPELPPALMESPGMTLDRVRVFAQAASVFFAAKPWRHSPEDMWELRSPVPDPAFRFLVLMGSGGVEFGIGFFRSIEQYQGMYERGTNPAAFWIENKDAIWSVTFDELEETTVNDGLLWEREKLPKAGKTRIPVPLGAIRPGQYLRPDPPTLSFLEGVLRALARLEGKHVRDRKLSMQVQTFDGPGPIELAIVEEPDPTANRPAKPLAGLQLKVTIAGSKPPIWRRLAVRDDATLEELHWAIQTAFGWTDDHMHEFNVGGDRFTGAPGGVQAVDAMWGGDREGPSGGVVLRELGLGPKSKLKYTYDFGDSWEHAITVEKSLKPDELDEAMSAAADWKLNPHRPTPIAACLAGKRAGPIEDCGGIWGYAELCAIMADPKHPEHDERKEWVGCDASNATGNGGFDPERFDLAEVNKRLKRLTV